MGFGRYVVSRRPNGTSDISFVPIHVNGHVIKVKATSAEEALDKMAGDLCAEVVSPSDLNQGCFLRCVAILLTDLLSSQQKLHIASHVDAATAFLDGVDAASMRKGEPDVTGLQRMRSRMSEFVRDLVNVWDNVFDPAEAGDATIGSVLMCLAQDDIPDLWEKEHAFRQKQSPNATEPPEAGTEAAKQETEFVLGLVAKCLSNRTADSGSMTAFATALMLGVHVHVYTVAR